ncbi:MAG TPA: mandelate racemase [Chromatiaceae bacterium]|jgi:L-alanine-DL-glutamate epimerase-like enolase superfamily enzyme|nr:MAG: hypothetical protein N838_16635 [Thiohalocapsa sp. PB-PSB1]QQO54095.1 MAG: mandelate racemase/muconate lactonizing enzyme family protein [Thiohalocapsa sp. PB-PSB1]HBG93888.1 mandelate racemase [Chromatiaceae bacterium]HCS91869.1 mandelate racemase [Chromatiaceae bacterium]
MYPTRIQTISVFDLILPLRRPYSVSGGRVQVDRMQSVIVRIDTECGLSGWGESCPFGSAYLPAFAAGIHAGIAELAPRLLGEDPLHPEQLSHIMDGQLSGHDYVKSALDMACWDLLGQHTGLPLYALLGGRFSKGVDMMGVCPNDRPEAMAAAIDELRSIGYRCFSPKVGGDVALDIARIRAILDRIGPGETIVIDANRAWRPDEAVRIMNAVADDPRPCFEQPCETLDQCLSVRRLTRQPIIVDEAVLSFVDLLRVQSEHIAEGINIKLGRVGGLTKARRMRDFCVATGMCMNIEETGGTLIASTAAVHLAVATPPRWRLATSDNTRLHDVIPASGGYVFEQGQGIPPQMPGLGIQPDLQILGAPTARYS